MSSRRNRKSTKYGKNKRKGGAGFLWNTPEQDIAAADKVINDPASTPEAKTAAEEKKTAAQKLLSPAHVAAPVTAPTGALGLGVMGMGGKKKSKKGGRKLKRKTSKRRR